MERWGEKWWKGLIISDNQAQTCLIITINDTSTGDLPLIITISDTWKNQTKRFDFDNTINLSSLIVSLGFWWPAESWGSSLANHNYWHSWEKEPSQSTKSEVVVQKTKSLVTSLKVTPHKNTLSLWQWKVKYHVWPDLVRRVPTICVCLSAPFQMCVSYFTVYIILM
jgi:hypothetical protein